MCLREDYKSFSKKSKYNNNYNSLTVLFYVENCIKLIISSADMFRCLCSIMEG